jgi:hypothetical protein
MRPSQKYATQKRIDQVTQRVVCLPGKHEALSSNSSTTKKGKKKKGLKLSLVNGFMFLAFAGEVLVLGFELSASLLQGKPLYYLSDTSSLMLPIFKRHFCTILVGKLWCRKKFYKLFK